MSDFMTLAEAYEKAGDGDIISSDFNGVSFTKADKGKDILSPMVAVDNNWQITPAKSIILSAEEYMHKDYGNFEMASMPSEYINYYRCGFKSGDKTGQSKERKNLQPLIDAVEKFINDPIIEWGESGIIEAFHKIKPLSGN